MDKQKLNLRAMTVFFMLFSGATLPFSGLVLHQALSHDASNVAIMAMAFHNIAALTFAISTVVHLKYNWRPILGYLRDAKTQLLRYPREMAIAGSTLALLLMFAITHVVQIHW